MITTYKFRLYPDNKQQEIFSRYFGCNRVVWSKALELREKYYREHNNDKAKRGLNYYDTAKFIEELKKKESKDSNRSWKPTNSFMGGCPKAKEKIVYGR
ncbi:MAG: helix-turn-helix domain-containing protein [Candidatus Acidifodinimicrobium sp.]